MSKYTKRKLGQALRDNLPVVAGFSADHLTKFTGALDVWVTDRHPVIARAGYVLHVLTTSSQRPMLEMYERGARVAEYAVVREPRAAYGVYGAFEDHGLKFLDLGTGCCPIVVEEDGPQLEQDGSPGIELLQDLVSSADRADYERRITASLSNGCFQLIYVRPAPATLVTLASGGGTGLLEAYPFDQVVRTHVHERNLAVAGNCAYAFRGYIGAYARRVQQATTEKQLRALGPPDSPPVFPRPAGASDREYGELAKAGAASAFDAWQAIQAKLDQLWAMKSAGSAWLKLEISADTGDAGTWSTAGQKFGVQGKYSFNFEADTSGQVKLLPAPQTVTVRLGGVNVALDPEQDGYLKQVSAASELEVPQVAGAQSGLAETAANKTKKMTGGSTIKEDGTGSFTTGYGSFGISVSVNRDRQVTEFSAKMGAYGFKFDEHGTCEVTIGIATTSGNVHTGQVRVSGDFSLKEYVLKKLSEGGREAPSWAKSMPELKVACEAGVQVGPNPGDVMRVIAEAPGLWQMRPRTEFVQLAWSSLDPDEQACLQLLGFEQRSWDFKLLPKTAEGWWDELTPEQKMATLQLPIPAGDPYWQPFWKDLEKRAPARGDLSVIVNRQGTGVEGARVSLRASTPGSSYGDVTDARGQVSFSLLPAGPYEISAVKGAAKSRPANVELPRGARTTEVLELV